jgi:hypothetical protein
MLLSCSLFGQDSIVKSNKKEKVQIKYPNVVKINTLAIPFNNISLTYERGILPRLSAGLGVGYKIAGTEPKIFTVNNSTINVQAENIQGFSITPGGRYYLRACEPQLLEGFYAGLYFRYTRYFSNIDFIYSPIEAPKEYYNSEVGLNEYGFGIQLGYQFLLWERFSIDFLFIGPRFSSYHLTYEFKQEPSEQFLDDLSEYMNEVVDRFGLDYTVDINQQGERKASTTFSFLNIRFGISLGFAF